MTDQYSYDPHLREEDDQLFHHDPRSYSRQHKRAVEDIVRDLKRHGYIDYETLRWVGDSLHFFGTQTGEVLDDSETASVTLEFTATADGELIVPAGTRVFDADPTQGDQRYGAVVFETDEELTVSADSTGTVAATAEHPGAPYNVDAGTLEHLDADLTNFESVTNPDAASGGVDHQLARLAVYRTLALVYRDLGTQADDRFDYKRQLYEEHYAEELKRAIASGIDIDLDGDGEIDEGEEDLEHGSVRLHRS